MIDGSEFVLKNRHMKWIKTDQMLCKHITDFLMRLPEHGLLVMILNVEFKKDDPVLGEHERK